jgi:hypothetical protein
MSILDRSPIPSIVVAIVLLSCGLEAKAANGEGFKGIVKRVAKAVVVKPFSYPIPLFPGSRIKFNVAPKVTEGTNQIGIGIVPRVHADNSKSFGVVGIAFGERSTAGGLLYGISMEGSGYGVFAGVGGKHGAGLFVGQGDEGNGFGLVAGVGGRHGAGLVVGVGVKGNGFGTIGVGGNIGGGLLVGTGTFDGYGGLVGRGSFGNGFGGLFGSGGDHGGGLVLGMGREGHGFGGLFAKGKETANAALLAWGAKKHRSLATPLVNLVRKLR